MVPQKTEEHTGSSRSGLQQQPWTTASLTPWLRGFCTGERSSWLCVWTSLKPGSDLELACARITCYSMSQVPVHVCGQTCQRNEGAERSSAQLLNAAWDCAASADNH